MTVIDRVILKGRCIVIYESLLRQVLEQLHVIMGIEKTKILEMYWIGMNMDIENHIKLLCMSILSKCS